MVIIFKVFCSIFLFFIILMLAHSILFYLQSDGYRFKSVNKHFVSVLKDNYINIFMSLVIILSMYILDFKNIYFCLAYLILEFVLWVWAGNRFLYLSKIKYTKRMIRLISVYLLLSLLFVILVCCFSDAYYLSLFFPFVFFCVYIIMYLSMLILLPVEKLIALHFILMAKKKLKNNTKLVSIGITGSYGKTSVKEILNSILSNEKYVLSTPKSFNTPLGISKTINDSLKPSHEIFICEMGAKKRGEILELCKIVDVDCGIVTSVGRQHLETFGSIENVYKTKKELPDYLYQKLCVFNLMNKYTYQMYKEYLYNKIGVFLLVKRQKRSVKTLKNKNPRLEQVNKSTKLKGCFYEFLKTNNVYAKNINLGVEKTTFEVYSGNQYLCNAEISLIGIHNVINCLLAIAMAIVFGVSSDNIVRGLKNVKSIKARFEKAENSNGAVIINNGYNSNLDSAVYSLKALRLFDKEIKLVVTPGLIECKDMYWDNYEFGKLVSKYADEVIVVKRINRDAITDGLLDAGFERKKIYYANNFQEVKILLEKLTKDYVVLIENDLPENFE